MSEAQSDLSDSFGAFQHYGTKKFSSRGVLSSSLLLSHSLSFPSSLSLPRIHTCAISRSHMLAHSHVVTRTLTLTHLLTCSRTDSVTHSPRQSVTHHTVTPTHTFHFLARFLPHTHSLGDTPSLSHHSPNSPTPTLRRSLTTTLNHSVTRFVISSQLPSLAC